MAFALAAVAAALVPVLALDSARPLMAYWPPPEAAPAGSPHVRPCRGLLVGADDYVVKPYARDELLTRIRSLLRRSRPLVSAVGSKLTRREREVLQLLAEGFPQIEIADRLFITKKTVGTHLTNLCRKLDVDSQAVAIAYREDILEASAADYAAAAR